MDPSNTFDVLELGFRAEQGGIAEQSTFGDLGWKPGANWEISRLPTRSIQHGYVSPAPDSAFTQPFQSATPSTAQDCLLSMTSVLTNENLDRTELASPPSPVFQRTESQLRRVDFASHVCSYAGCGKSFRRKGDLTRHVNGAHCNKSSFLCPFDRCPRSITGNGFHRKDKLIDHLTTAKHGLSREDALYQATLRSHHPPIGDGPNKVEFRIRESPDHPQRPTGSETRHNSNQVKTGLEQTYRPLITGDHRSSGLKEIGAGLDPEQQRLSSMGDTHHMPHEDQAKLKECTIDDNHARVSGWLLNLIDTDNPVQMITQDVEASFRQNHTHKSAKPDTDRNDIDAVPSTRGGINTSVNPLTLLGVLPGDGHEHSKSEEDFLDLLIQRLYTKLHFKNAGAYRTCTNSSPSQDSTSSAGKADGNSSRKKRRGDNVEQPMSGDEEAGNGGKVKRSRKGRPDLAKFTTQFACPLCKGDIRFGYEGQCRDWKNPDIDNVLRVSPTSRAWVVLPADLYLATP
jgi:hypothetical protein